MAAIFLSLAFADSVFTLRFFENGVKYKATFDSSEKMKEYCQWKFGEAIEEKVRIAIRQAMQNSLG